MPYLQYPVSSHDRHSSVLYKFTDGDDDDDANEDAFLGCCGGVLEGVEVVVAAGILAPSFSIMLAGDVGYT